jgi:hypothetical protein
MRFVELDVGDAVCVCLTFGVGMDTARDPRSAQLAHYAEHMCARLGSRVRRVLELAAVKANAWTDGELTCFYAVGAVGPVLRVWLPAMVASLRAPDLSDARVRNEAHAARAEIEIAAQAPRAALDELIAKVEAPYSGETSWRQQSAYLARLADAPEEARVAVARFARAHYARAHALAVGHARHRAAIEAAVEREVGACSTRLEIAAHPESACAGFGYGAWHEAPLEATEHAHVEVRIAIRGSEPQEAVHCAAEILRGQMFRELRDRRGLVYSVFVGAVCLARSRRARESGRDRAWVCVSTSCAPVRVEDAVRAILGCARRARAPARRIEAWRRGARLARHVAPEGLNSLALGFVRDCAEGRAVRTPEMHARAAEEMPDELARSTMRRVRDSAARGRYVVYTLGAKKNARPKGPPSPQKKLDREKKGS